MPSAGSEPTLRVAGVGMVTPVGFGAAASCAAARAGITRLSELEGLRVSDPASGGVVPATGHVVRGHTDGFSGVGRLVRLGVDALADLLATHGPVDWRRTGLFLTLSSDFYRAERDRADAGAGAPSAEIDARRAAVTARLVPLLARHLELAIPADNVRVVFADATGIVDLLRTAAAELASGRLHAVVVGGIGSLVEPEDLRLCHRFGVLKTPGNPSGFLPGEAAAVVLLEASERAGACTVEAMAAAREPSSRLADEAPLGHALAAAIGAALERLHDGGTGIGLVVGALNGDAYRAYDFGHALVRVRRAALSAPFAQWYPALAFGETGAAAGAVGIAMAANGLHRAYTRSRDVLVWMADDTGARAALVLRAPAALQ